MKMKNVKILVAASLLAAGAVSCSKDFLDPDKNGLILEENYYSNETEAYGGLVAVYDLMRKQSGGFENLITFVNAGSDDHYAGGGGATDGTGIQSFSDYTISEATVPGSYWNDYYQGIFRANILLEKLPGVPMDETVKMRFTSEAKALRAFYYFDLVRLFGHIPLILSPVQASEWYNVTQATREEVYAQMELDLTEALASNALPSMLSGAELGRITKGAAQALLGKIYLYDNKLAEAAAQLAEVNGTPGGTNQYGNHLLANYADLWNPSNKFNAESLLEVSHTAQSNASWGTWGTGTDEGNTINVMVGPRGYGQITADAPDYATGWSFNVLTQSIYDVLNGDQRFASTIADLKTLKAQGKIDYLPGYMDTGYFLKKFMPLNSDVTTGGGDAVLNYRQDSYPIRLADTYLLEAEAVLTSNPTRAAALVNAVRTRVGLAALSTVTLNDIKLERRKELAGEGHRWFDLVRWNDAATALAAKGFTAGKNEILPIPYLETQGTKIEQNLNY